MASGLRVQRAAGNAARSRQKAGLTLRNIKLLLLQRNSIINCKSMNIVTWFKVLNSNADPNQPLLQLSMFQSL